MARRAEWRGDIQSGAVCVKTVSREESEPSPASPASRQSLTRPSTITKRQFTDANYQSDNFKSAPSGRAPLTTNNVPTQLPPAPPPGLPAAPGAPPQGRAAVGEARWRPVNGQRRRQSVVCRRRTKGLACEWQAERARQKQAGEMRRREQRGTLPA